jgi:hypothetical protein
MNTWCCATPRISFQMKSLISGLQMRLVPSGLVSKPCIDLNAQKILLYRWISTTVSMISCWQQKADRTFSTRTSFPRVQDGLSYCIRTNVNRALPRTPFSSDGSTLLFLSLPPSPSSVNYARVLCHGREEVLETRVGALGRFTSCGEGTPGALISMCF